MSVPQACTDPTCARLGIGELSAKRARRLLRLRPRLTPALRTRHRWSDDRGVQGARIAGLVAVAGFVMTLGLSAAPSAQASSYAITQVPVIPSNALLSGIGPGGDGGVWFSDTEYPNGGGAVAYLARVDPASLALSRTAINPALTDNGQTWGVAAGPGGTTWFTRVDGNSVSRINPSGAITDFPLPIPNSGPSDIHEGPDGAMWFIENRGTVLGRIDSNGSLTEYPVTGFAPDNFTVGSDGNFWVAIRAGQVLKVSTSGQILASYAVPDPAAITTGSDGALWVTSDGTNSIFRLTTDGAISQYTLPGTSRSPDDPGWITSGADGALWFTESKPDAIGRMTTDGTLTDEIPLPTGTIPVEITTVGNAVWFSEQGGLGPGVNGVGKIETSPAPPPGTPPPGTPPPGTRVVLVTGLDDPTPGQAPGGDCKTVGSFRKMCKQLTSRGFRVSVVSSSATGRHTVINNHGGIDGNAKRLADEFRASGSKPALFVGHSMGGIIARVAITRYGAPALGLFTIGSPHDGSFGADLAVGGMQLSCLPWDAACNTVHAAGNAAAAYFGAPALVDLSQASRQADNANLSAPTVPVWVFAGTACSGPNFSEYLWPNDGIVGESSAFGHGANLGKATEYSAKSWHVSLLRSILSALFGCMKGGATELTDETVIDKVLAAASQLEPAGSAALQMTVHSPSRSLRASPLAARARSVTVSLASASSATLKPGAQVPSGPRTAVFSTQRFSLKCGQRTVPSLPALGGRLFGTPAGDAPCAHPRLAGTHRLKFTTTSNPTNVRAVIRAQGTRVLVTVRAHGLRSLSVRIGKRTLSGHRRGATVTVTIRRTLLAGQVGEVLATVGRRRLSGSLILP